MRYSRGVSILGVLLLLLGLILILSIKISNYNSEKELQSNIESNTIRVKNTTNTTQVASGSSIEVVSSNMKLKKVKSYKNVMVIPSLGIKAIINEGVTSQAMSNGVGHFTDSVKCGQYGNTCYAGHYSDIYNCIFNDLPKIKVYDEINLYDKKGKKYTYYVTCKYVTEPTDMSVLNQDTSVRKLTIVTCSDKGRKRLIIEGMLLSKKELQDFKRKAQEGKNIEIADAIEKIGDITICDYIDFKGMIPKMQYNTYYSYRRTTKSIKEGLRLGGTDTQ